MSHDGASADQIRPTPDLAPLIGALTPKTFHALVERDARSQELTDSIDEVTWSEWIDGDHRLIPTGEIDGCSCEVMHWRGADNSKSVTLHDGCEKGCGAHIWSGTMMADLDLDVDHLSRLQLAAALHEVTIQEAARAVGVQLGGGDGDPDLASVRPEHFEQDAAEAERRGDHAAAEKYRHAAVNLRSQLHLATVNGVEVGLHSRVAGGVPTPPAIEVDGEPDGGETAAAAAPENSDSASDDAQAAAQAKAEEHMAAADTPELLDKVFCTPLLKEIRQRAAKAQVSPMLALSANINGLLSVVPHNVCLPKITGKRRQPLNLVTVPVDESGGGKGGACTVDIDPVPHGSYGLPDAVTGRRYVPSTQAVGSGEAIAACYASIETDKDSGEKYSVNHTDSVWLAWDEVAKIIAVRDRKGSTIEPELCHGFSWERLGSATKTNPFWVEERTYRMLVTICAQLVTAAGLLADEYTGLVQRIWWVSAAYAISEEDAQPEKLAAGRRTADGQWFAEPDDEEPLILVELPEWPSDGVLPVAASVAAEIEAARAAHGRKQKTHPWDRHQLLIRLRLAAAGAMMHGCAAITATWWEWAELLIEHSNHVRDAVVALRGTAKALRATEDGRSDAVRAEARSTAQWRRAVAATERWAKNQADTNPETLGRFTEMQAQRAAGPGYRKDNMADILAALEGVGKVVCEEVFVAQAQGNVFKYRYCN